jgi:hypothetical protein
MQGDSPNVNYGPMQRDYRRLFYSDEAVCLMVPITLAEGYGVLKAGTALAKNTSALTTGNKNKYVPYNPSAQTGAEDAPVRAYLRQGSTNSVNVHIGLTDSYKFKVGDDVIIDNSTLSGENLGAITAIDRTTYPDRAVVSATTAVSGTGYTTATFSYLAVEGCDDCVGILGKSIDTGTGEKAAGANASMLLSNYIVYTAGLINVDAAAIVDLSLTDHGQFTICK